MPLLFRRSVACLKRYKNHLLIALGIVLVLGVVIGLIVGLTVKSKRTSSFPLLLPLFLSTTLTTLPSPIFTASAEGLANAVTVPNIMNHLQKFYDIAMKPGNNGSRGVLEGYNDCLEYVRNTLAKTGCVVRAC